MFIQFGKLNWNKIIIKNLDFFTVNPGGNHCSLKLDDIIDDKRDKTVNNFFMRIIHVRMWDNNKNTHNKI